MSRLGACLERLRIADRKALATFITAGDPTLDATVPALHAMVAGGADVLELGVPFSDPEADGPAIQASSQRGLAQGTTMKKVLEMVRDFRHADANTPILLMGYLNSVLAMGVEAFSEAAGRAGVDGLIIVNLPPEEADDLIAALKPRDIDLVFLVAPTTTPERTAYIARNSSGFIYYVSLKGITGAGHLQVESIADRVINVREISVLPVLVGFGITNGATARAVARFADGVVIGSALVKTMADAADSPDEIPARLSAQIGEIRAALDG